jgi:hypothetical protein
VNPCHGVVVSTTVCFLFGSGDFESVLVPTQPSGSSIEETNVGVAEPERFNGGSGAGDWVDFNLLSHQFAKSIPEFLWVFVGVLVFLFDFKGYFQAIVIVGTF